MSSNNDNQKDHEPLESEASNINIGSSPFLPKNLINLFARPEIFFGGSVNTGSDGAVFIAATLCGISGLIGRTSTNILRAELGRPRPGWNSFGPLFTDSWASFWIFTVVFGVISGFFYWKIGGWWYQVRVRWSGAVDPDRRLSREIYVFASLVVAIPSILLTIVRGFFFENFGAAILSDDMFSGILIVFPVWSIITGYKGVRANFDVVRWRAQIWLVVLPALLWGGASLVAFLFSLVRG